MIEGRLINIGAFVEKSYVNGPGARAVIWLQGCLKRCPGCINPQFWDSKPKILLTPEELTKMVLSIPEIEGVTYSGGEPFLQAGALSILSEMLKEKGMTIVCYSGYTYEEIVKTKNSDWLKFLGYLDILIDGEFMREKRQPLLWRSSSNQKIYFLTEKYRHFASEANKNWQGFEFHINGKEIILTGFIDKRIEEIFLRDLWEFLVGND